MVILKTSKRARPVAETGGSQEDPREIWFAVIQGETGPCRSMCLRIVPT